jgi:ribosomal protein S18 acetylase RimI-like enzyme
MPVKYPVVFANINIQNVKNLEVMIEHTFPLSYSESFYDKVVNLYSDNSFYGKNFSLLTQKLAIVRDVICGGITCRVEEYKGEPYLYILALCVFESYRRGGVAVQLYEDAIKRCKANHPEVKGVYIHTPENNIGAIKFYEKLGFSITNRMTDYYHTLDHNNGVTLEIRFEGEDKTEEKSE